MAGKMNTRGFFRTLLYSLSPVHYRELIEDRKRDLFSHFLFVLLIFIIISSILFIPSYSPLPKKLNMEFNKFTEFKIDTDVITTEPAHFGFLTIDTPLKTPPENKKGVVISNEFIQIKFLPFIKPQLMKTDDFRDVLKNVDIIVGNIVLFGLSLVPYFIMLFYFYQALKIGIMIIIFSMIFFFLTKMFDETFSYREIFRISGYASIFLMIELLLMPYKAPWFIENLIPVLLYVAFIYIVLSYLKTHKGPIKKKDDELTDADLDIFRGANIKGL